jgi:acyl-coenzyme A thioesterase PaaI-like protein
MSPQETFINFARVINCKSTNMKQLLLKTLFFLRPNMIYEQIKIRTIDGVPFAKLAGVQIDEVSCGTSTARLVERPDLTNHIGTMHAAALFALGEAASGAAMAGTLGVLIMKAKPVASDASIKYLKLAKGTIIAVARVDADANWVVKELEKEGKIRFDVMVDLNNEGNETVAQMKVEWHIRINQ